MKRPRKNLDYSSKFATLNPVAYATRLAFESNNIIQELLMKFFNAYCPFWLATLLLAASTTAAFADVVDYVKTPDPAFSWKIVEKKEVAGGTIYDLHLVSQVWQGIKWEHQLQVYLPKDVKPTKTMFLWNQG